MSLLDNAFISQYAWEIIAILVILCLMVVILIIGMIISMIRFSRMKQQLFRLVIQAHKKRIS